MHFQCKYDTLNWPTPATQVRIISMEQLWHIE